MVGQTTMIEDSQLDKSRFVNYQLAPKNQIDMAGFYFEKRAKEAQKVKNVIALRYNPPIDRFPSFVSLACVCAYVSHSCRLLNPLHYCKVGIGNVQANVPIRASSSFLWRKHAALTVEQSGQVGYVGWQARTHCVRRNPSDPRLARPADLQQLSPSLDRPISPCREGAKNMWPGSAREKTSQIRLLFWRPSSPDACPNNRREWSATSHCPVILPRGACGWRG